MDRPPSRRDILQACREPSSTRTPAAARRPAAIRCPTGPTPGYDRAAARALLRGADQGDTAGAEAATGYYWGDPALFPQVERILAEAREDRDDRLEQLAERFLRGPVRRRS